jgi:hypothetical protein
MQARLFSEAELQEMGKRSVDRLTEAIDAGDTEKAKQIAKRMYNEFLSMHDLYRNWTTATLSAIGRRFGDQVLDEVMTEGVKAWWLPNLEKMAESSTLPQRIKRTKRQSSSRCGHAAAVGVWCWKASTRGRTHF